MDRPDKQAVRNRRDRLDEARELYWLRDQWRNQPRMWEESAGARAWRCDAGEFQFGGGLSVVAFDLERTKARGPRFDTGRIAGELETFFMAVRRGNKYAADPFIGHFLWNTPATSEPRKRLPIDHRQDPFLYGNHAAAHLAKQWVEPEYRRRLI